MSERRKLTDILGGTSRESLAKSWNQAKAAEEFAPLPTGDYVCHVTDGTPAASRKKETPGYKMTFKVIEGEYAGRLIWHDLWFTNAALPMTKRDLAKIGIKTLEQTELPIPQNIRVKVKLALRRADDGTEYNKVRSFEVLGVDEIKPEPFAPADDDVAEADAGKGETEELFPFGANVAGRNGPYTEGL